MIALIQGQLSRGLNVNPVLRVSYFCTDLIIGLRNIISSQDANQRRTWLNNKYRLGQRLLKNLRIKGNYPVCFQ